MAEVLSSPATTSSASPTSHESQPPEPAPLLPPLQTSRDSRVPQRERISSYARNCMSTYSQQTSRSRPQSSVFPVFHSSLPYALVRDFAYPAFHPMHYGPPPSPPSGATTPGSEWNTGPRRLSDPMDAWSGSSSRGNWSAGPWGGDGVMYGESDVEPLPSTSFGSQSDGEEEDIRVKGKHRKRKSYTHLEDFTRGRRRDSQRRSRLNDGDGMFYFSGQEQAQNNGNDGLRVSTQSDRGNGRRDSHFAATLPSRSFHHSQPIDSDLPLDSEVPTSPLNPSPQRESMGPEDEAYAGPSLALYNFTPENPNELALTEGQTILVSYRHGQGWLVAEDPQSGEQGLVPEEYVRLLRDIEGWDEETGQIVVPEDVEMYDADDAEEIEDMREGQPVQELGGMHTETEVDEVLTPVARKFAISGETDRQDER